jgi:hypothetical protein
MCYKNEVTAKLSEILEFPSFDKTYWQPQTKIYAREYQSKISMTEYLQATHHKYRLWFWRPQQK